MILAAAWGGGEGGGGGGEGCCPWSGLKLIDKGLPGGQTCRLGQGKRINNLGLCY